MKNGMCFNMVIHFPKSVQYLNHCHPTYLQYGSFQYQWASLRRLHQY